MVLGKIRASYHRNCEPHKDGNKFKKCSVNVFYSRKLEQDEAEVKQWAPKLCIYPLVIGEKSS